jgi:hypothetical protein
MSRLPLNQVGESTDGRASDFAAASLGLTPFHLMSNRNDFIGKFNFFCKFQRFLEGSYLTHNHELLYLETQH